MIHIMKAFFYQGNGDMYKDTFDKAFRRDRVNIEIVFVKLKNSWIVLKYLNFVVPYACQIVIMCCVLHNFCRMKFEQLWSGKLVDAHPNLDDLRVTKRPNTKKASKLVGIVIRHINFEK